MIRRTLLLTGLAAAALALSACGDREEAAAPATPTGEAPAAGAAQPAGETDPGGQDFSRYAPELPPSVAATGQAPEGVAAVNGYWPDGRPITAWTAAEMPESQLPPLPGG